MKLQALQSGQVDVIHWRIGVFQELSEAPGRVSAVTPVCPSGVPDSESQLEECGGGGADHFTAAFVSLAGSPVWKDSQIEACQCLRASNLDGSVRQSIHQEFKWKEQACEFDLRVQDRIKCIDVVE
jgi:hypothetical protein